MVIYSRSIASDKNGDRYVFQCCYLAVEMTKLMIILVLLKQPPAGIPVYPLIPTAAIVAEWTGYWVLPIVHAVCCMGLSRGGLRGRSQAPASPDWSRACPSRSLPMPIFKAPLAYESKSAVFQGIGAFGLPPPREDEDVVRETVQSVRRIARRKGYLVDSAPVLVPPVPLPSFHPPLPPHFEEDIGQLKVSSYLWNLSNISSEITRRPREGPAPATHRAQEARRWPARGVASDEGPEGEL